MFSRKWIQDTLERALSTAAQVAVVAIGGQSLDQVVQGYEVVLGAALLGFFLTIMKSIAAAGLGDKESASLVK